MSDYRIETKCIQSGYEPGNGEARVLPIYQSTTFRYTSSEQMGRLFDLEESGYFYTRLQNPTNDAVAAKICDLEGGYAGMLTSSGQAANFYAIMNIAEQGDHIVCASALYGGTYNLYAHTIKKMGVDATFVDPDCSEEELEAAFRENTKAVFGESIANPALVVLDLQVRRTDTEFRLLWIIRLQHRLTAVRLSGEQILLPTLQQNIWMAMRRVSEVRSLTVAILTGMPMQINFRDLRHRIRHITELYIQKNSEKALILQRQQLSL